MAIVRRLLAYGSSDAAGGDAYTTLRTADNLVRTNPNAWLLGVVFDQLIPAERAWLAPYRLRQRLGHLSIPRLARTTLPELKGAIRGGPQEPALARYPRQMAKWIRGAAQHVSEEYSGNARNIWDQAITAGEVVERLFLVPGISFKKAHMATRILHEGDHAFCRRFKRWDQINVAVDSLVRRVWLRTGLTGDGSTRAIMTAASVLHSRYPGELDYPSWLIGREWCHPKRPACHGRDGSGPCPLSKLCPQIGVR